MTTHGKNLYVIAFVTMVDIITEHVCVNQGRQEDVLNHVIKTLKIYESR